jgi:hypothetical protein
MTPSEFESFLFDRPLTGTPWYFDQNSHPYEVQGTETLQLVHHVLLNSQSLPTRYSNEQISHGLNFLINPSCSDICYLFVDSSLNQGLRASTTMAIYEVFEKIFQQKCLQSVPFESLSEPESKGLNWICYMWWDIFPRHGIPTSAACSEVDMAIIRTLNRIAQLPSFACKESAIHGLGHWASARPEIVAHVFDLIPDVPANLVEYMALAKTGHIQ